MTKTMLAAFALALVLGATGPAFADRDETEIPTTAEDSLETLQSSENHAVVLQENA